MALYPNATRAADQGAIAFCQAIAVLACLRAACDSRDALAPATISTTLDIVGERFDTARGAFDALAAFSRD